MKPIRKRWNSTTVLRTMPARSTFLANLSLPPLPLLSQIPCLDQDFAAGGQATELLGNYRLLRNGCLDQLPGEDFILLLAVTTTL